jgi:hypothetical protein
MGGIMKLHTIGLRVDDALFDVLKKARKKEGAHSLNELVRDILLLWFESDIANNSIVQTSTIPRHVELKANTIEKEVVAPTPPKKEYKDIPLGIPKEDKEESTEEWLRKYKGSVPSDRDD